MTLEEKVDAIYEAYPRKVAARAGKKAILACLRRHANHDDILEATKKFKLFVGKRRIDKAYIPFPATYFNQDRWEDAPEEYYPMVQARTPLHTEL